MANEHRSGVAFFAICFLLPLIWQTPLVAQTGRAHDDLRSLSKDKALQVGRQDLASILKSGEIERESFSGFSGIRLHTASFSTRYAGLCRLDVVVVKYMPERRIHQGRRLYEAQHVEVEHRFHVVQWPTPGTPMGSSPENLDQPGCTGLTIESLDGWFKADDEHQAATAITMLTWPSTPGPSQLPDSCGDCGGNEEARNPRNLDVVRSCPGEDGTLCYKMHFFYRRGIADYVTTLTIKAQVTLPEEVPIKILSRSYDTGMVVH